MIENERNIRTELVIEAGKAMMRAARTAPKGKGIDQLEIALVQGESIKELAREMLQLDYRGGKYTFTRDSNNLLQAQCVVLIGYRACNLGLNCMHCGYPTCAAKPKEVPCAMNAIDVGVAVGSACAIAADWRVDTRVMYSAGLAAQKMGLLPNCSLVTAIPVSASSKNPFFDRKPTPSK